MYKNLILIVFVLWNAMSFSQVGGQSVYQFLNLMTSPRQAAMGGKVITLFDYDVNQGQYNPASINSEMDNHLALNYGSYYGEVSYGTASYAYTYDRHVQTFHAGINYINYGSFDGRDENGIETGSFSGSEAALSFGYTYNLPFTDFYIGGNAKLITSTLESYTSFGAAIDLGCIYIDERNDINYALVLRNMGSQITTYAGVYESLPFEIIDGISQELEHVPIRWHLTLENLQQWNVAFSNPARAEGTLDGGTEEENISFINNALRHAIFGVELFPRKGFNVRFGYNFRRSEELKLVEQRTFAGLSLGFGLRVGKMRFEYSYSRYTLAGNTSLFGLMINLQ